MMTPLQRFKARVLLGTRMELTSYVVNGNETAHKYKNVERKVGFVGSRAFAFNVPQADRERGTLGLSYCDWPKASELTWLDDNTAQIGSRNLRDCQLTYRFCV